MLLVLTVAGGVAARMVSVSGGEGPNADADAVVVTDPEGAVSVQAQLDRQSVMLGDDGLVRVELSIEGEARLDSGAAPAMPTDLVVVLDRSGSMSGDPIAHARAAVMRLVDSLGPQDRFSLITYASSASTVIPLTPASDVARTQWRSVVSSLGVGGGTNMSSGLDLGAAQIEAAERAGRVARLVLVSDGLANEGDASREGLLARATRAMGGEYVVSTVGVGSGFDEALMTALADAGTGNFYYIERSDDLGDVFAGEFASARTQVASALQVELFTAPGVQVVSASGYPLEVRGDHTRFRPGALFAGQARRIWVTFRVPSSTVHEGQPVADLAMRYVRDGQSKRLVVDALPKVAVVADRSDFVASLYPSTWAASVTEDEVGVLKSEVAASLRANDTEGAVRRLRAFRAKQSALNQEMKSPAVAQAIADAAAMEETVGRVAESQDRAEQGRLQKTYSAEGYDARRRGAKYQVK